MDRASSLPWKLPPIFLLWEASHTVLLMFPSRDLQTIFCMGLVPHSRVVLQCRLSQSRTSYMNKTALRNKYPFLREQSWSKNQKGRQDHKLSDTYNVNPWCQDKCSRCYTWCIKICSTCSLTIIVSLEYVVCSESSIRTLLEKNKYFWILD